jgi:hypothetical protein
MDKHSSLFNQSTISGKEKNFMTLTSALKMPEPNPELNFSQQENQINPILKKLIQTLNQNQITEAAKIQRTGKMRCQRY